MTQRFLRVAAALAAATLIGLPILSALSGDGQRAPVLHASRLAGIAGAGLSGLLIQNMDAAQSATIVVDFYKQSGGAPVSITRSNVAAASAANVYLPAEPALQNGAYAAVVSADRSVRTLARTDWNTSGGAIETRAGQPGTDVLVPFGMKGFEGQNTLVSIQNTDTGTMANVQVQLVPLNGAPLVTTNVAIMPGTSTSLHLAMNLEFASVPSGTSGYLRITAPTHISVGNIVDVETSQKGVFAHEGIPVEQASDKLFAPLVHAAAPLDPQDAASAPLDTLMMVVNPGGNAVQVVVRYAGVGGGCQGQTFAHPAFALAPGAAALVAQAPGAAYPPVAASPLPAGCTAAAVIEATGGQVVASVVDRQGSGTIAAAYNALAAAEGDNLVRLPLARRNHTAGRLTTAIQAMNMGTQTANVTLTWRDNMGTPITGCAAGCTATIAPGGAHLFWPPSIAAIPDNSYGSAELASNQPLGVVVSDIALAGGIDLANYVGLGASTGGMVEFVPILFLSAGPGPVDTPTPEPATPTPRPTDTPVVPSATPVPTATPSGVAVSDAVRNKVPAAAISAALANPARVAGWGQPRDPGKPVSPANPLRECLTLVDPGKPYHPLFNGLIFKAGCP